MGRRHKDKSNKVKAGKVCPKCGKAKLEKPPYAKTGNKGHEHHVVCLKCHWANF